MQHANNIIPERVFVSRIKSDFEKKSADNKKQKRTLSRDVLKHVCTNRWWFVNEDTGNALQMKQNLV